MDSVASPDQLTEAPCTIGFPHVKDLTLCQPSKAFCLILNLRQELIRLDGTSMSRLAFLGAPRWVLRRQKLQTYLLRTQPLEPGVGQYMTMYASPTARDVFLANFYRSSPFTCIFFQTSPEFFLCWLWLRPVPVWARRIK